MSVAACNWAVKQRAGGAGPKAVLLALAHHADTDGVCYPSQSVLAEEMEMDERTVRRHVAHLESAGIIERIRRTRKNGSRKSDAYRLNLHRVADARTDLPDNLTGSQADNLTGRQPDTTPARTLLPDNLTGCPAENGGPTGQKQQTLPGILPAPTSFELPEDEEQITDEQSGARTQKTSRRWRTCPTDWQPNETHRELAAEHGIDFELELAKFRDHEYDKPKLDPDKTFRNWLRNAISFQKRAGKNGHRNGVTSADERLIAHRQQIENVDLKSSRSALYDR